jgi:colanic acid biosynthesis glycosyl transferase WcaI
MSKILIHSIAFSPDGVSTAYIYNDIALKFKEKGFDVVVLSTTPHYNIVEEDLKKQPLKRNLWGLYLTSNYKGIKVKHIPQKKYTSSTLRILGFIYWHFASFILGLFEKKIDIILSPSPPLTLGYVNIILGKLKGAKVIYNVQEIYPDLLISEGGLKSKPIIFILKWLEKFVYNHSDKVTTIDKVFCKTIVNRFKDKSKLHIIPNFVDTSIYKPSSSILEIDPKYFPHTSSLKLMYAGNIGLAQDWGQLVKTAIELKEEKVEFFIIGEGVMKSFLEDEIKTHDINNIHLIPYQPRETMSSLIDYSDIQFIFMSPQTEGHGFPSKVYTIMACAKPMLVCSGLDTPIMEFLKNKNCAYLIEESDVNLKSNKIIEFLKSIRREELIEMGKNGLNEIKLNYSKEIVTDMYINLVSKLLTHSNGRAAEMKKEGAEPENCFKDERTIPVQ